MPDIFGRDRADYTHIRAMDEQLGQEAWNQHQDGLAVTRALVNGGVAPSRHDFDMLGRAPQDATAVGFITNNMLAIQSVADEILYTDYRLPLFVSINSSIPEGARSYGLRVRDRRGRAQRVSAPSYDAPSATVAETIVTQPMHYYGLDAIWSVDELREAMFGGVPLDTESVDAAVRGCMETMEAVGLLGGYEGEEYSERGLLNLTNSDDGVIVSSAPDTFANMSSVEIRNLINGEISSVIENSRETLGRNISTGMTIYLPGAQYDLLTTRYIGDNAQRTLMASLMADNPWTHFTSGAPLTIHRVLELAGEGASDTDRMVTALKHPRVAEMGVSINPRVLRILDRGRVISAQIEAKFSPLFVKRGSTIRYRDGI